MIEELPEDAVKIGEGVWYTKIVDKNENWIGIVEWHLNSIDNLCEGFVAFDVETDYIPAHAAKWTVESFDPLTISPSVLCTVCNHHGYIRDGRWVDC
jgi:hypothetical protein